MAEKVSIIIDATDNASAVLRGIGGSLTTIGTAAVAAAAVATAAIAGVAVLGAQKFIEFEGTMNEVFTLMPGVTGAAMDDMSAQVLQFSKDMKVLPDEVVPALYQSISAGIPQENVFTFLETAQMAAVGGVTELETAVDGISSVMNAYGEEVVNAAQASDIMFTGVRLGKTTFGELSASLFQVIPTAASMGIAFEDVTASLVTLTGQGVPTRVATTQLRQLFIEASDSGTVLGKTISELAGESFNELIAGGGNVSDILNTVRETMPDNEFRELFGSVEAMNAALGITGPNFEKVQDNLDEMGNAAGATAGAFDTMNAGAGRGIEGLKAFGAVALIQIGQSLEPLINAVIGFAEGALPKVQAMLDDVIIPAIGRFMGWMENTIALFEGGGIQTLFTVFEDGSSILSELFGVFGMGEEAAQNLATGILTLVDQVTTFAEPIVEAVTNFISFKDVLIGLAAAILVVLVPAIGSLLVTMAPILLVFVAVAAGVALLRAAWENNWGGIQEKVAAVIAFIVPLVQDAIAGIKAWWAANGEEILSRVSAVWNGILSVISSVISAVSSFIQAVLDRIRSAWSNHGDSIVAIVQFAMGQVQGVIDLVTGVIRGIWNAFGAQLISNARTAWENIKTVIDAAMNIIGDIIDAIAAAISGDWEAFGESLRSAADTAWTAIKTVITNSIEAVESTIETVVGFIAGHWQAGMANVVAAIQPAINLINGIKDAAISFWNWLSGKVFNFKITLPSLPSWATPGSPLPIHTAWKEFANDMNSMVIRPQIDFGAMSLATLGGTAINNYYTPAQPTDRGAYIDNSTTHHNYLSREATALGMSLVKQERRRRIDYMMGRD